jgi:hypothetical protein
LGTPRVIFDDYRRKPTERILIQILSSEWSQQASPVASLLFILEIAQLGLASGFLDSKRRSIGLEQFLRMVHLVNTVNQPMKPEEES